MAALERSLEHDAARVDGQDGLVEQSVVECVATDHRANSMSVYLIALAHMYALAAALVA